MRRVGGTSAEQPGGMTTRGIVRGPSLQGGLQFGDREFGEFAAGLFERPAVRREQAGEELRRRLAEHRLPGERLGVLGEDAPDAAADLVATRVAEVDLAVVDDRVGPVGDVEGAVRAHLRGDRTEGDVARTDDVGQFLCHVAGLRGVGDAEVVEAEADDAVRAEVAGDRVALPVRAEERAVDEFESAELRVGAGADAADEAAGAFGGREGRARESPMHAGAIGAGGEEGLAGGVLLLTPGVDEALRVDFETFGVRVVGESHAGVGAHEAPRGLKVRVDVDRLMEVEATIDAPVQRVDDMMGVFGAEAAEHDATVGEDAVGVRVGKVQEFGAGADIDAAEVVGGDAGGDEQAVGDDAGDVGDAVVVGVFEQDHLVVAGGRTELGGIAGHLRGEVFRVNLRVGVGGRDPQAAGGVPIHVDGLLEERVLGEERDAQAVGQLELRGRQGSADFELRRGHRFGRQRARLAGGDRDGVGFGLLDERVELRDFDGVVALFALTEAEDVGVVGRAAAVEEERVLSQDRGAQGFRGGGGFIPGILVHAPAQLGGDAFAERAVAAFGEVDAVVGAEVEGDAV